MPSSVVGVTAYHVFRFCLVFFLSGITSVCVTSDQPVMCRLSQLPINEALHQQIFSVKETNKRQIFVLARYVLGPGVFTPEYTVPFLGTCQNLN